MNVDITAVTVTQTWNDESMTKYHIEFQPGRIVLSCSEHIINLYPESWPEIRFHINHMIDLIEYNEKEENL